MRDHELEEQVKAAFDSIELPQTVKQQTLDRILDRSSADAHVDRSALSSANEKAPVIEPSFKRSTSCMPYRGGCSLRYSSA